MHANIVIAVQYNPPLHH